MAAKKKANNKTTKASAKRAAKRPAAKAVKRGGLNLKSVSPGLTVSDIEKSLVWYRDVLGFTPGDRWESKGKLMGVELSAGNAMFMIGQDDWQKGRDRIKGQGVRLYCETGQDIDRLAAQIKANGGTLAQEPKDQSWGMRDIAIDDPDGYKITIAANLKKRR
jgi:lactoylglutathione lyase